MSAIDDLISTLLDGTEKGFIVWEQADSRGRSFLTTRGGGTVLIEGPANLASTPATVRLVVKDSEGHTLEEVVGSEGRGVLGAVVQTAMIVEPPAVRAVPKLYAAVKEAVTRSEEKLRRLNREFGGS